MKLQLYCKITVNMGINSDVKPLDNRISFTSFIYKLVEIHLSCIQRTKWSNETYARINNTNGREESQISIKVKNINLDYVTK